MAEKNRPAWQEAARVFDQRAAEYDKWYDDSLLFAIELAALKDLQTPLGGPRVEVGCGPGRFAAELDVILGIDPAWTPLTLAAPRLAGVCQGVAEHLPLRPEAIGTLFVLFTLCFVEDPLQVVRQAAKVLRPGGHLVLGLVPGEGPWGRALAAKGRAGHPFYRHASFYEVVQVEQWLAAAGFRLVEQRSSLYQGPDELHGFEPSRSGRSRGAGFVVLVARKG
ncbi:MAG: hypothetical protein C0613_01190 [Desulfobulbaceae bacterium]|nr:MAG: hypothetical protein C0613_01190 [Desulfobulbaceae bacterium]